MVSGWRGAEGKKGNVKKKKTREREKGGKKKAVNRVLHYVPETKISVF